MTKNKNQAVMHATALSRALGMVSRGAGKEGLYETGAGSFSYQPRSFVGLVRVSTAMETSAAACWKGGNQAWQYQKDWLHERS